MASFSRHPASAPPVAPERERTRHLLLRGWMVFSLFFAFTAPGWVLGFGVPLTAIVGGVIVAGSAIMVAVIRPPFQWRRLPWIAGTLILWAGLSIAWSGWRETSALTWLLLVATTFQGVAIASVLTSLAGECYAISVCRKLAGQGRGSEKSKHLAARRA